MIKSSSRFAVTLSAMFSATAIIASPAIATEPVATANASERINLSGELRMLSQRLPAAACQITRSANDDSARETLIAATAQFQTILEALENGDPALNIAAPETRRKTLADIEDLRSAWTPFKNAAEAVIAGTATNDDLHLIFTENMAVLNAAQRLTEELVRQYANPNATTHASLMLIDIAGRQRMLTQEISKSTCLLGTSFETSQTVAELERTIQIFEASLEALRFGMPAVGILPPPNDNISASLNIVYDSWNAAKPQITAIVATQDVDNTTRLDSFEDLNIAMTEMNTVVNLYMAAAR